MSYPMVPCALPASPRTPRADSTRRVTLSSVERHDGALGELLILECHSRYCRRALPRVVGLPPSAYARAMSPLLSAARKT